MREAEDPYRKLVLVCLNDRGDGVNCCMNRGSGDLYPVLKEAIKERYDDVRVSSTGCLGNCATGISVVIMPDDLWLGEVTKDDIPSILDKLSEKN